MQKLSVQPNIIKKNAEALLDANKEIGLEVNSEKTKFRSTKYKVSGSIT
jgi:hypothetical protein